MTFRYCPHCAHPLTIQFQAGRQRGTCPNCGWIHYRNPTVGVAVAVLERNTLLLGRRAPQRSYGGLWCIPCGHVEWDEEVRQAAKREFLEETGLAVALTRILAVHSNFHNSAQHTVGVWFQGKIKAGVPIPGDDLDALDYFPLGAPPTLAFPTDDLVVKQLREGRT